MSFGTRVIQETDLQSESSLDSSLSGDFDTVGINRSKKRAKPSDCVVLSTAPDSTPTHWAQVRIYSIRRLSCQDRVDLEGGNYLSFPQNQTYIVFLGVCIYCLCYFYFISEVEFPLLPRNFTTWRVFLLLVAADYSICI